MQRLRLVRASFVLQIKEVTEIFRPVFIVCQLIFLQFPQNRARKSKHWPDCFSPPAQIRRSVEKEVRRADAPRDLGGRHWKWIPIHVAWFASWRVLIIASNPTWTVSCQCWQRPPALAPCLSLCRFLWRSSICKEWKRAEGGTGLLLNGASQRVLVQFEEESATLSRVSGSSTCLTRYSRRKSYSFLPVVGQDTRQACVR